MVGVIRGRMEKGEREIGEVLSCLVGKGKWEGFCENLKVCLVGGVEKWEDGKLWEDGKVRGWKIFSFPLCVFDWRDGKVGGWKTLLFC